MVILKFNLRVSRGEIIQVETSWKSDNHCCACSYMLSAHAHAIPSEKPFIQNFVKFIIYHFTHNLPEQAKSFAILQVPTCQRPLLRCLCDRAVGAHSAHHLLIWALCNISIAHFALGCLWWFAFMPSCCMLHNAKWSTLPWRHAKLAKFRTPHSFKVSKGLNQPQHAPNIPHELR